ncbi:hypothetical protein J1G44_16425 [Cellulomonas sp. zg-ZUI199]|uniref:ATP synthase protein I n=1 Tax=Cellulomonas wangleii TaxID=2816956 RepID=A0ABX8D7C9_9CELL|nr:hypothetical protein [Cellulomonas wangleii]MBO0926064.1 hypothetical protein [Cellulomonas wangleii]QVI63353.1 hypothetical protein KG103_05560 [Cellulomonas wangleii]
MTTSDPTPAAPAPDPTAAVFRRALRDTGLLLGGLAVVGLGAGALLAGAPGVWGALIGVGLALVFSGTTVVAMLRTLHSPPTTMAAVVMGTWLAKVLVVVVVLALLRDHDFYSRGVLAAVLALGVVGAAVLDFRAVQTGRVPYVEPGAPAR